MGVALDRIRSTRRVIALLAVVLLTGCETDPNRGAVIQIDLPQSAEQCRAQPELDWC